MLFVGLERIFFISYGFVCFEERPEGDGRGFDDDQRKPFGVANSFGLGFSSIVLYHGVFDCFGGACANRIIECVL